MLRICFALASLLVFAVIPCNAQIIGAVTVGETITKEQAENAKAIIRQLEASNFQWNVGDFQIFQKGTKAKGELEWDISDDTIISIKDIPANVRLMIDNGIRAGETVVKDYDFPAQATSYWKFKAVKAGVTSITIWGISEDGKKPVRIAKMLIRVGPAPPKPDDPVDPVNPTDPLAIAAAADLKAGKGTTHDVEAYAGLFLMYGTEIKNGKPGTERFATAAQLNKEMNEKIDQLLGVDHVTLDTLRTAVGKELVAKIPTITASSTKIADIRAVLSDELLSIYKRLGGK